MACYNASDSKNTNAEDPNYCQEFCISKVFEYGISVEFKSKLIRGNSRQLREVKNCLNNFIMRRIFPLTDRTPPANRDKFLDSFISVVTSEIISEHLNIKLLETCRQMKIML